jgi:ATP-dependent Clp protease ATP-binding subunit ClpX
VKQYAKLMAMEGVSLTFEEGALDFIVEKAVEYNLGARGLRSICEAIVTDAMYDIPSDNSITTLVIDEAYARSKFDSSKFKQLQVA